MTPRPAAVRVDDKNQRDATDHPLDHWKQRVDPAFGPAWATTVRLAIEGPAGWVLNGCRAKTHRHDACVAVTRAALVFGLWHRLYTLVVTVRSPSWTLWSCVGLPVRP